jgi:hypothetical protein
MSRFPLTPEQQDEAQRIERILMESVRNEIRSIAELLASKPDRQLLGQTEFEVRDLVHKIGAKAIETALDERKKGGTKDPQLRAVEIFDSPLIEINDGMCPI